MTKIHSYELDLNWTGNRGAGTYKYTAYDRKFNIKAVGKPNLQGSADPLFRGDPHRYNPEEMFVASVASCHMLWYLHLCASNNIIVVDYSDHPLGKMELKEFGEGEFVEIILSPKVFIKDISHKELALSLHRQANEKCFIAKSLNFPILHAPQVLEAE
ncbi:OsmC family protein [Membranihabitans maritimus]|uniref:OsmC family protein n=1 Tax=Membranihabitans maritimus TaxID=2904244 RepID=UPI001F41884B|nr:OsmC family protein [Membranihabitans maritimus]